MNNEEFQGFTNVRTWCVALTIDNKREMLSEVMKIHTDEDFKKFMSKNKHCFFHMAPWVWSEGCHSEDLEMVNTAELLDHYNFKRMDGVK